MVSRPGSPGSPGGKIPQQFIDDLVARLDIVELIDARVPLRKAGRNYVACCPFHAEKTPSFTVSPEKQFYHCFGCGAHGSAIGFLMAYDHMGFIEAVTELAQRAGLEIPHQASAAGPSHQGLQQLLRQAAELYRRKLQDHAPARQYLAQRGLDDKTADEFQIGYAPPEWSLLLRTLGTTAERRTQLLEAGLAVEKPGGNSYDRFRDRIMFPIHDARGQVLGFGGRVLGDGTPKYLNSPETAIFHKGQTLYGRYQLHRAHGRLERVLVVEGYMDVVALAQHGIRYVVATLGTAVTGEHVGQLLRLTQEVIFCFDGDAAGRQAAWRALESTLPRLRDGHQIRFMFLPEGEDPDSLVRSEGGEAFEPRLNTAVPLSDFFFQSLTKQVNLDTLDGRARLVELARPHLSKLSPSVFSQMMVERLGQLAHLEAARMARFLVGKIEPPHRPPAQRPARTEPSLVRRALSLLLHMPSLAERAGDVEGLKGLDLPGASVLAEVLEFLRTRPNLNMSAVLEHWRNTDTGRRLDRLAQQPPLAVSEDPEGMTIEFADALQQLRIHNTKQRIEKLLARSGNAVLSEAEKRELQELLVQQRALQQLLSSHDHPVTDKT